MAARLFECAECNAFGKITLKGSDHETGDIAFCPVCGADIYEEDDFGDEE